MARLGARAAGDAGRHPPHLGSGSEEGAAAAAVARGRAARRRLRARILRVHVPVQRRRDRHRPPAHPRAPDYCVLLARRVQPVPRMQGDRGAQHVSPAAAVHVGAGGGRRRRAGRLHRPLRQDGGLSLSAALPPYNY